MSIKYPSDITIQTKDWSGPLPLFVQLLRFYKINPDTFLLKDIVTEAIERVFPGFPQDLSKESEFLVGICMLIYLKSRWLAMGEKIIKEANPKEEESLILPENYLSNTEIQNCVQFLLKQQKEFPPAIGPKDSFRPKLPAIPARIKFPVDFLFVTMKNIETKFQESTQFFTISRKKKWNIKQKIQLLKKILLEKKECVFSEILTEPQDTLEYVVSFSCILMLFYKKEIFLIQNKPFTHIFVKS